MAGIVGLLCFYRQEVALASSEGSYGSADVKTKLRFYRKTLHLEYGRSSDFLSEKIKK
jgi:hypothetical protein